MLEQQAAVERAASHAPHREPEECVPPEPVTEFQTARLFLSNFGYLNIGGDKKVRHLYRLFTASFNNSIYR
ncbi:unnamed protein product [Plutella xylostella]|uniref:(diamondback moth) hypothetical protein n=1 Tax=Plutella xylostella TaxID=51655 RepID=A0A8S4FNH7_PLUXY|nr:unnamed protein product [Plutella xylostella]